MGKVSDTCAPRADIPHAMHMQCDVLLRGAPLTGQDVGVPVADWKEARRLLSLLRTYPYPHAEKRKKRIPSVSFLPNPRPKWRREGPWTIDDDAQSLSEYHHTRNSHQRG